MKTAISLPDPLFEAAEEVAQQMGLSRSQLYAKALTVFLTSYRAEHVTERLNQLYTTDPSTLDVELLHLQALSLPQEEW